MTPEAAKASLDRAMRTADTVILQRGIGDGKVRAATPLRARFLGFDPTQLVGTISETDRRVVVPADDVAATGMTPPLLKNDRLDLGGRLYVVKSIDDTTRRIGGVLVAYELQVSGA